MLDLIWPDTAQRLFAAEELDDPRSDPRKVRRTLRQFFIINILFNPARRLLKKYVIKDMWKDKLKTYSFLDMGTGGCDIPVWFAKKCRRMGLHVLIFAMDHDKRIVEFARKKSKKFGNIKIIHDDCFNIGFHPLYDYIFASNFLHHQHETFLPRLLMLVHEHTKRAFILNDLYRSRPAFLGFTLFALTLLHSSFHLNDGRLSIRKGFRENEIRDIIKKSCLNQNIKLKRIFPAAFYIYGLGSPG